MQILMMPVQHPVGVSVLWILDYFLGTHACIDLGTKVDVSLIKAQ
jgi:hypothetical protein